MYSFSDVTVNLPVSAYFSEGGHILDSSGKTAVYSEFKVSLDGDILDSDGEIVEIKGESK